jgi:hypothetical protein
MHCYRIAQHQFLLLLMLLLGCERKLVDIISHAVNAKVIIYQARGKRERCREGGVRGRRDTIVSAIILLGARAR